VLFLAVSPAIFMLIVAKNSEFISEKQIFSMQALSLRNSVGTAWNSTGNSVGTAGGTAGNSACPAGTADNSAPPQRRLCDCRQ
jgi:hypothetical protein